MLERTEGSDKIKIVSLAGGSGRFTLLEGLRDRPEFHVTALFNPSDSGGSSGEFRVDYGILPIGDGIQAIAALACDPIDRDIVADRFEKGHAEGHRASHYLYTAAYRKLGSNLKATQYMTDKFPINGQVLPTSETVDVHLIAEHFDGTTTEGEHLIDTRGGGSPIIKARFSRPAALLPEVGKALQEADIILFGPGDLWTSTVPHLLVDGMPEAIAASSAQKILICNLFTKPGETDEYTSADFAQVITHCGDINGPQRFMLDAVLVNKNGFHYRTLRRYQAEGQHPIKADPRTLLFSRQLRQVQIVRPISVKQGEKLVKLFRNDADKTVDQLMGVYLQGLVLAA